MADAAIFDLTPETALTAAHEFVTQDTSAATRARAATFALMGGLEYVAASVTTANLTATVGTLHALDLSGLTADRNFVLPDTARVGERVGVFVTVGDADFELDIVTAATGSLINGSNAGGGTSWSRLFITNEVVILRCVKAGGTGDTDWIVEVDGRIPSACRLFLSTNGTNEYSTANVFNQTPFDTEKLDIGELGDVANNRIVIRRAGNYVCTAALGHSGLLDGNKYIGSIFLDDDATEILRGTRGVAGGADVVGSAVSGIVPIAAAAIGTAAAAIQARFFHNRSSGTSFPVGDAQGAITTISAAELLSL